MVEFEQQRQSVIKTCLRLAGEGYLAGTGGNASLRLSDELFAITPSATEYPSLTPEDIAVLRLDTLEQVDGTKPASIEKAMHAQLHHAFPGRRACIHTHQPVASAVALLHQRLEWPEGTDTELNGDHVGLAEYQFSGTKKLVDALNQALRPNVFCYLLASHGVIAAASSLEKGAELVAAIEFAAAQYLAALIRNSNEMPEMTRQLVSETLSMVHEQGLTS